MTRELQPAKAFVIQFRAAAESEGIRLSGRLEHVSSGRTANFQSLEELSELLLQMLRRAASEEATGSE